MTQDTSIEQCWSCQKRRANGILAEKAVLTKDGKPATVKVPRCAICLLWDALLFGAPACAGVFIILIIVSGTVIPDANHRQPFPRAMIIVGMILAALGALWAFFGKSVWPRRNLSEYPTIQDKLSSGWQMHSSFGFECVDCGKPLNDDWWRHGYCRAILRFLLAAIDACFEGGRCDRCHRRHLSR